VKVRDVFAAMAGCSGARRRLTAAGAALAIALLALPAAASADCPNEAIRARQHAENLGACRAWEMVSPLDKNGGEVDANGNTMIASSDGNGFTFTSHSVFGDAVGSGVVAIGAYLSRRSADGWSTHGITPLSQPTPPQIFFGPTETPVFSADLSRGLTRGYDLPGATDDAPNRENLYLEDTATRDLRTISLAQIEGKTVEYFPFEFFVKENLLLGASSDLLHFAWMSLSQLLPDNTAPGYPNFSSNVYTWDDGKLHLAGLLPDGTVPAEGSWVTPTAYRGAMSADGSRQAFLAAPTPGMPQLYLRIDHSRTAWITESENPSFPGEAERVAFEGMTPDGKNVFFVTDSPLLEEDQFPGSDLYRWTDSPDPETDPNLTLVTHGGALNDSASGAGGALVGMSNDGEIVYYYLSSGDLEVSDRGQRRPIAFVHPTSFAQEHLNVTSWQPGYARVSPDGRWLAYIASGFLDDKAMRLYDLESDSLLCASCPAGGGAPAHAAITPTMGGNRFDHVGTRPNFLTDDGRAFFSTEAPLLPEDVNGAFDAYEFDGRTGALHLLSSGRGEGASMFADASRSGDDVFIATRQSLVAGDTDSALDFYDVRAGGGFVEPDPPPRPCEGDACQGPPAPGQTAGSPASSAVRGAGNVKHRRCGAKRRKVRRAGKVRCVKRHRNHRNHQRANRNRRAGR
jgi:hypothetical protein